MEMKIEFNSTFTIKDKDKKFTFSAKMLKDSNILLEYKTDEEKQVIIKYAERSNRQAIFLNE